MPRSKIPIPVDDRPPARKPSARSSAKARKTAARLNAVQIVYQAEVTGQELAKALQEFADYRIGQIIEDIELVPADRETLDAIIGGLIQYKEKVDELLDASLRGTSLDRLELLLRSILRAGTAELLSRPELPPGMIISDYLSVTDGFYGMPEVKLVNGALDAVFKTIRSNTPEIFTDL